MSKISSGEAKKPLLCSFCGKSQHEVRKLIAGPTVFICDECVELCIDIIGEENKPTLVKSGDGIPPPRRSAKFSTTTSSVRIMPRRCSRSAVRNHYKRLDHQTTHNDVELAKSNILLIPTNRLRQDVAGDDLSNL
jgi:ATP-dependent Clp protease ATP-binding subunit ClpX